MKELDRFDWAAIEQVLAREGQALLPCVLSGADCDALTVLDTGDKAFGDVGTLDDLLLGGTELRQLKLPSLVDLRKNLFEKLVPIANRWNATMGIRTRYPARLDELLRQCREAWQVTPQSVVLRLRAGEQLPLKQNAEGDHVFPLQVSVLLKQPGSDFTGGEMIMTEQRPRMQTRPMVVPLQRGDATVFAVHHRPFQGSKGSYRVNLRHAVSRVRSGERIALDLVFHNAPKKTWTLLGADRKPYQSDVPGSLGGHRGTRIYGQLTCRAANRAISRGGYVKDRVFFVDEATAKAACFRPCAVCMPLAYEAWKAARLRSA